MNMRKDKCKNRFSPKLMKKRRCYLCNRVGHIAKECFRQGGTQKGHTAMKESTALQCQEVGYFTLESGIKIPMVKEGENTFLKGADGKTLNVLGLSMQPGSKMPVVEGQVNGGTNLVSVLRDTGGSGTVIKRSLCKDSALTGEVKPCLMINGQVILVPVAEIQGHTPYFSGDIKAMVMENPFYDLVIGNLKGAREAGDPDLEWKPNTEECHTVTTRSQKVRKPLKPLKVAEAKVSRIGKEELRHLRERDATLGEIRGMG